MQASHELKLIKNFAINKNLIPPFYCLSFELKKLKIYENVNLIGIRLIREEAPNIAKNLT